MSTRQDHSAVPAEAEATGAVLCNLQLPGFTLRCTADGAEPTPKSPVVRGPITAGGVIRVVAFSARGRKGATEGSSAAVNG